MENNTNFQTFHQMGAAINDFVKQATGRDNVQNIDIDHVTVAQNHYYADVDVSGSVVSFHAGAAGLPLEKCVVQIEPVQEGSGDPSPDNVRPITGWTGAKVTRTGKNLCGGLALGQAIVDAVNLPTNTYLGNDSDGNYVTFAAGSELTNKIVFTNFKPNKQYTFILKTRKENINSANLNIEIVYSDGTGSMFIANRPAVLQTEAFVTDVNKTVAKLQLGYGGSRTFLYYEESGIFEGVLTVEDFEPYTGQTYDIAFPSEAGTVYGGTLDAVSGVLVVDRMNIASYNGETLPGKWISDRDVYVEGATPMTGAQVVYELAEPITYHLTPTEITTLLGVNNIWADTGDIEVKFTILKELY